MNKTVGILAHVDAGKTTLAEQILYHTKSIRSKGRVDHKNSFLDSHSIEKNRGITIFSDQGIFNYKDCTYNLVDTPGHIDFSTEMERAIEIMDYAIIILSGVEGVQGHSETVWQLLRKYNVPTFFFINKIDRVGADASSVLNEIKTKLTKQVCNITSSYNIDNMEDELIEFIAEQDDSLFEKYLEGEYEEELWLSSFKTMIKECKVFPCMCGSALQDIGVNDFLDKLHSLTFTNYSPEEEFGGRVYKIRHDEQGNRVTYIKCLSGTLKVKDEIHYDNGESEKVNQIRIYNGNKYITTDSINAGEVFAVTGITKLLPGDGVGKCHSKIQFNMVPTLTSKVIFNNDINAKDVLNYFKILESEDPTLNVTWDENLQEIHVNIMGIIQLEVLKQVVEERFNIIIEFGQCEILYKETIDNAVKGYGHFEPLKHYAEVHLLIEPAGRGSGITYLSQCHVDNLSTGYQNLVGTHIHEKIHKGILTGSALTDVKITLITGRAHEKHTHGGDFREATYRALRQGLEKADNVLLEPFYGFKIEVELEHMGRVLSDIQKLNGTFNSPKTTEAKVIITGRAPVATFMNYNMELISFTKGKGSLSLIFDGYDVCHNTEEVIEKRNYKKDADPEYTSNSIFCSKGAGYTVKWDEAESYMHCL